MSTVTALAIPPQSRQRRVWTPFWFLLPAIFITCAVVLLPVAQTAWLSMQNYLLYDPSSAVFVGFGNFIAIMQDEVFWISLWNSLIWIIGVVGLQFLLGLGAALLLNQSFWWRGLARSLIIIPWALPSVIIGLMWTWMYDFNLGVINDILIRLGILDAPIAWLARPDTALAAVMFALIWQGFPFFAVTILAGLQTVPAELYEAAEIDGVTPFQRLIYVTLPSHRRRPGDGASAADDLGGEFPRRDPGDDRRRAGLCHPHAAAVLVPSRL